MRATLNETILAESDQTIMVEGNHDFPPDSVNQQYFRPSDSHTMCGWKGLASYYDVEVEGEKNGNAAWYYESPRPAAKKIAGYVAFWHGVKVNEG